MLLLRLVTVFSSALVKSSRVNFINIAHFMLHAKPQWPFKGEKKVIAELVYNQQVRLAIVNLST